MQADKQLSITGLVTELRRELINYSAEMRENKENSVLFKTPKTPSNWHWAITHEQIAEIKQGNREVINQVYFDNFEKFRACAIKYLIKRNYSRDFIPDLIQQIYLLLPNCNYTNTRTFYASLFYGFKKTLCGRLFFSTSLDKQVSADNNTSLSNFIGANDSYFEDEKENDKRVLELLKTQEKSHTMAELDKLTAVAYGFPLTECRGLYNRLLCYCKI